MVLAEPRRCQAAVTELARPAAAPVAAAAAPENPLLGEAPSRAGAAPGPGPVAGAGRGGGEYPDGGA
jgi:hypothetical protein